MTEQAQIRINELARELEVKAKAILELLPGLGVVEKRRIPARLTWTSRKKSAGSYWAAISKKRPQWRLWWKKNLR